MDADKIETNLYAEFASYEQFIAHRMQPDESVECLSGRDTETRGVVWSGERPHTQGRFCGWTNSPGQATASRVVVNGHAVHRPIAGASPGDPKGQHAGTDSDSSSSNNT